MRVVLSPSHLPLQSLQLWRGWLALVRNLPSLLSKHVSHLEFLFLMRESSPVVLGAAVLRAANAHEIIR